MPVTRMLINWNKLGGKLCSCTSLGGSPNQIHDQDRNFYKNFDLCRSNISDLNFHHSPVLVSDIQNDRILTILLKTQSFVS